MTGLKYMIALGLLTSSLGAGAQLKDREGKPVNTGGSTPDPKTLNRVKAPGSESIENNLGARQQEYNNAAAELQKLTTDSIELQRKVDDAGKTVSAQAGCTPTVNGFIRDWFSKQPARMDCPGKGDGKAYQEAQREFANLSKRKDEVDRRVRELNKSLPNLAAEINRLQDKVTADKEKNEAYQKKLLADLIAKTKIDGLLDETEKEFKKLDKQMAGLEAFFDQLNMAYYMRVKMEKLINSQQMCDRVKSCGQGPSEKSNIKLDTLFSEGSAARRVATPDGGQN